MKSTSDGMFPLTLRIRRNSVSSPIKILELPDAQISLQELLRRAGTVLDLDNPAKAYQQDGILIKQVQVLEDNELVIITDSSETYNPHEIRSLCNLDFPGYKLTTKLGQGGFGTVYAAVKDGSSGTLSSDEEILAIKLIAKSTFVTLADLQRAFNEMNSLRNLKHPNVIALVDVVENRDYMGLVMEYAKDGELQHTVTKKGFLDEDTARTFFQQIAKAVLYCHMQGITHNDLKLSNCVLYDKDTVKLVDFGLARFASENSKSSAGTEAYIAPEVYHGANERDPYKIDSWSSGIILYAMTQGQLPFSRPDKEACDVVANQTLKFRNEASANLKQLIYKMLCLDVRSRASLQEITTDKWLNQHRFSLISHINTS
jgi:serine/threonine protein kinase